MEKKISPFLIGAVISAVVSAVIAFMIYDGNTDVIFSFTWPTFGLGAGITGIVLSINALKDNAPKWLCITTLVISIIAGGICGLNFMACVMCNAMWIDVLI